MKVRHYFIDWVRVLAFLLLIFYHTGMLFNTWGWHIKNREISSGFEIWMELINPWRLSLLFFISGVGASFATKNKTFSAFAKERMLRLFIPLVFGILVIVPPQIYLERVLSGFYSGSYLQFYSKVFELVPYPEGNFSWHHLWFIVYLLVFSLLAIPLFKLLKGKQLIPTFQHTMMMIIPLSLCYLLLRDQWPTTHNLIADCFNFSFSFLIFIFGYIFGNQEDIWNRLEKNRYLNLGTGLFLILFSLFYDHFFGPLSETYLWVRIFNSVYKITFIFCTILGLIGFAKKYLNYSNQYLTYSNRAVYPFYILHQTVIIILGYYWLDWRINVWIKFLIICISTVTICWIIYHFVVKNFYFTRILFGVKSEI